LGISSTIFTTYIKELVDRPLKSLQTEIILQKDNSNKNPQDIKTIGVILPFNLQSFPKNEVSDQISKIPSIKDISTSLVLWQFDIKNNRTLIALDVNEPKVGLRNIESMLMTGSKFFTANDSQEIILERHFATLFKYKVGQDYQIGENALKIVGLVDFQEQSNLANAQGFLPYQTALKLIGEKDNIVNQTFISLQSASDLPKVKDELTTLYPSFSIISKDNLLKNLSGLSQMFYRFGTYFSIVMTGISLLLAFSVLRLHRLEYAYQTEILTTLGWPKRKTRLWVVIDTLFIFTGAIIFAFILALILQLQLPTLIKSAPMINYNIKL
jgi:predicted lysophospholipase L1 biosynthesis ABC-type transport system permease subunit